MAQHNTDYGLVYDDEGKICVTKRTDVVPFPGVTSYAVETGTTNFLGHTNGRINYLTAEGTTPPTIELVDMKTPWGNEAWKVTIPANNATGYSGCRVHTGYFNVTTAGYYSNFTYVLFEGTITPSDIYIYTVGPTPIGTMGLDTSRNINNWQYFRCENMNVVNTGSYRTPFYMVTTSTIARTFYIAIYQFEQKPFCSSFVIGSRPAGRLVVDVEDLGFNPGTDDWVVSYRKYPIATSNDTLTGYNLCSLGNPSNGYYFYWGKEVNKNSFRLKAFYNDGTYSNFDSSTFNPDDYFRHWHSEVVLKHDGVMEYWVDGVLQCQLTLTKSLPSYGTVGLSLGGWAGSNPCNSLITNITYGKYTDQWTPEYIQRISAMTSTFYVPTKRVIV